MSKFIENELDINRLPLLETLMSIGNGYMGVRGYLEEFEYPGSIRGNYINGIYERIPMNHAEWAHGFPLQVDRMPNLIDLFNITIFIDNEEVVIDGRISNFKRELDFEIGLVKRSYKYKTKMDKTAHISFESLVSFTHIQFRTWSLKIVYDGEIKVINRIDFNISNMIKKYDPRTASTNIPLIKVLDPAYISSKGKISLKTINSGIYIDIDFRDKGAFTSNSKLNKESMDIYFESNGELEINRTVKYCDSIRKNGEDRNNQDKNEDETNKEDFIDEKTLYKEQIQYLKDFKSKSSIEFLDDKELNNIMEFMRFHMLQATTRDKYGNISAKGLSGEGYEGHYFWDTEIFMFPVWLLWDNKRAKNLLLYRYDLLDIARERALEMGHNKGACFSWRTISGIESSGYFPAGSAQYHINFDIAYIFIQYWLTNGDIDFLAEYTMEILIETARTALEIGSFEDDGFHIHTVTGPDEYTALVSDNYYTNKMAQYNLKWTVKFWRQLKAARYDEWLEINKRLKLEESEIDHMEEAAEKMVFIYNEKNGIMAQDSTFLTKERWPEKNDLRPLLLNYHPLTIYRHQILKQADTVLAQYLIEDENEEILKNTFYYYEAINTHDSSLSKSISGLMASRLGDEKISYDSFMDTLYLDIKDLHDNTTDGLHMANIGGSIINVLKGFGGINIKDDGLHIEPFIPKKLGRVKFRFTWRESLLEVLVDGEEVDIKTISGSAIEVVLKGEKIIIGQRGILFDLDGVLTGTSDKHYEAWKKMAGEIGYDLPEEFRDKLRGVSRMESIDIILEHFGVECPIDEKTELASIKNEYYKESISLFTREDIYPGVIELLERLKSIGVKIGLVSASNNAQELIKNMEIESYFDAVADLEKLKRGKPYPDPFLQVAKMLNLKPRNCLGVEDAKVGIESIKAAGMKSLGIGDQDLSEAEFRYSTIQEASDFIIKWAEGDYGRD
nr:beta-phosphoglucomutase [Tissierella sp.]